MADIRCWIWQVCIARVAGILLIVIAGIAGAQELPLDRGSQPVRISVNVDLVLLHATVFDRGGHPVSGLQEKDFSVYEDNVLQSIRLFRHEDIPVAVGLVVDHSGSMRPKLSEVVKAARAFVHASNPEDETFVVNFNENVWLGLPQSIPFTNRSSELEIAIASPATGKTALYDAIGRALGHLSKSNLTKKVLILISDGGDNASSLTLPQVLEMAARAGAIIYTIGLFEESNPDRNPRVLHRLAAATGGEGFIPDKPELLTEVCRRIAHDIRHQYTIGFQSTNRQQPGTYRAIRVMASARSGRLTVRTRTGYVSGAEPPPAAGVK